MEYQTPGVYVREVDGGPKPIAAVSTSIPAFLGLFPHAATAAPMTVRARVGGKERVAELAASVWSDDGASVAPAALIEALGLKDADVSDLGAWLASQGHKVSFVTQGAETRVQAARGKAQFTCPASLIDTKGAILTREPGQVVALLEQASAVFDPHPVTIAPPAEVLAPWAASGVKITQGSARQEWSLPAEAIHNARELFAWLTRTWAAYALDTGALADLDADGALSGRGVDGLTRALPKHPELAARWRAWMSQPAVMRFVAALEGFYNNGGGRCWVHMMGLTDLDGSVSGDPEARTGLHAFDDCEDVAIMAAPGLAAHQQQELLDLCERRRDRFAILDGPPVSTGDLDIPSSDKGYGAMYVPWVKVARPSWFEGAASLALEPAQQRRLVPAASHELHVPPSGHIAGLYARVDGARGVHKAPANERLLGITGLSQRIHAGEQGRYNERGVNVVRDLGDRGLRVWGARTLATRSDPSWRYINVRRLFIMVEQSVLQGSGWAVFEPNDRFLWTKLTRDVRAFLLRVWRSGALFGKTAEEAFFVHCDDETNPRELIDAGQVNLRVGICPVKPAEFVVFHIGQWDGGAEISE